MSEKKGFLGFFKGLSKEISEEEAKQRDYALAKAREEEGGQGAVAVATKEQPDARPQDDPIARFESDGDNDECTVSQEFEDFCVSRLAEILDLAGFSSDVSVSKRRGDKIYIDISNDQDLGRIIGKEGSNLESLQIILRAICYKKFDESSKVIVDASGYRKKRLESVRAKATRAAKTLSQRGGKISLEPMNSSERRLVHMLFQDDQSIASHSEGEGHNRHIVLSARD